jgi:hypothetical protein
MATAARNGALALVVAVVLLAVGVVVAVSLADPLQGAADLDALREAEDRDDGLLTWAARVLLVLAVAWVVIGMLSARTRLVRRPGAAGARAAWLASSRPWRARESTLGMLPLDRWLMILVPGALLVATRAVQTALLGWIDLAVSLGAWLVFAVVVRLLLGRRSPWPVIAAVGGTVVLRCILSLIAVSIAGPGAFWVTFWTDPPLRFAYLVPAVALALWVFVAAAWALTAQFSRRRSWGIVLAGLGAALAVPAAIIALAGIEAVTGVWSGQLPGVRPDLDAVFGSRVAAPAAWAAAAAGAVVAVVGVILALARSGGDEAGNTLTGRGRPSRPPMGES